jgi:predicted small secreted protein
MHYTIHQLARVSLLCLGFAMIGGCNTVEGFGEDLQALGETMSSEAREKGDSSD